MFKPPGPLEVEFPAQEPTILLSPRAAQTINNLVDIASKEVSWLGTVFQVKPLVYYIQDIFLFKQTASWGNTEILTEGYAEVLTQLQGQPNWIETVDAMVFWGHSHHTMGVFASGTDDATAWEWVKDLGPQQSFFIRGIFNKRGEAFFSVYLKEPAVVFNNVPAQVFVTEDETLRSMLKTEYDAKVSEPPPAVTHVTDPNSWYSKMFGNRKKHYKHLQWGQSRLRSEFEPDTPFDPQLDDESEYMQGRGGPWT